MEQSERQAVLFKEADLIQSVIRRMAYNSFLIKGWTLTLVVAVLLLQEGGAAGALAFLPLIGFWVLDAWFLRQERLYRRLYEWVVRHRPESDEHVLDLDAGRFRDEVATLPATAASQTLALFYGTLAVLVVLYLLIA